MFDNIDKNVILNIMTDYGELQRNQRETAAKAQRFESEEVIRARKEQEEKGKLLRASKFIAQTLLDRGKKPDTELCIGTRSAHLFGRTKESIKSRNNVWLVGTRTITDTEGMMEREFKKYNSLFLHPSGDVSYFEGSPQLEIARPSGPGLPNRIIIDQDIWNFDVDKLIGELYQTRFRQVQGMLVEFATKQHIDLSNC
jgi:hypothetical protein